MLWADYMSSLSERMKEPEMASLSSRLMTGLPYLTTDELEHVLHQSLTQVLREIEDNDWESISSDATKTVQGTNNIAVPLNLVRVLGAKVDSQPSVFASPASFYQRFGQTRYTNRYTLVGGKVIFQGTTITLRILVEPTMDTWKAAQTPILPIGSDIRVLDIAAKRIIISDYVPEWRP